jgi:hypothetical protein
MIAIADRMNSNLTLNLFEQVYTPAWLFNLRRMLCRGSGGLLELGTLAGTWTVRRRHFAGRQLVPLDQIRGSESRVHDFDGAFRPRVWDTAERWRRVAEAWLEGIALPPVELIRVGDVYFVRDGHHRISVAVACGAREIDALVTVWEVDCALPWEQPRDATPSSETFPETIQR